MFLLTQDPQYAHFLFEMNDYLHPYQIPSGFHDVDLVGSFSLNGDVRVTATCIESIIEAYQIAERYHDSSRAIKYKKTILQGLRALLQLQVTKENCNYNVAIGGFKNTVFDNAIRVDNVQHAVCALHAAIKYIL